LFANLFIPNFISLKKIHTLFLLSVMLFAQYAKQFTYLECVFANTLKSDTVKCDCEKLNTSVGEANTTLPQQKNHVHVSLDETYTCIHHLDFQSNHFVEMQKQADFYLARTCSGIHLQQDRPPEFAFILV
jgi:hypothetical protein